MTLRVKKHHVENGKAFKTIVVGLENPTMEGAQLRFQVKFLEGAIPATGSISFTHDPLFIDGGFPCFIAGC